MDQFIIEIMNNFGYIGVLLLIIVESIFPPIPSEIILLFGGFVTTQGAMNAIGVVIAATVASIIGAFILYYIGRFFNESRLEKIVGKYGKYLRLKITDVKKAIRWYEKYEYRTVFFCRMIPVLRSLISIPAGMANMKIMPFLGLTTAGSLIWNSVLVYLGVALGENWESLLYYLKIYSSVIYVILFILVIICVTYYLRKRFMKNKK